MAEVYLARTSGLQGFEQEVCVKKILPQLTADENFVRMFVNEAKLAATLNYPNIVGVHDLCVSEKGEYFIVMEYVHGRDLSDLIRACQIRHRDIPPHIAVYVCREVCKGLHYAHTQTDAEGLPLNIIHRDISPHNILSSFDGEVKITDFGIAKASFSMDKTAVGILKGKYGYMSPEQSSGKPLDPRSDLFNTGIVLYELLLGQRCFAGSTDFSTLALMRQADVTPPTQINSGIPKKLEDICLRALARDPKERFQSAQDFEEALSQYAKTTGRAAGAPELSQFMHGLFSEESEAIDRSQTGILSLSSVKSRPGPSAPRPSVPRTRSSISKQTLDYIAKEGGLRRAILIAVAAGALGGAVGTIRSWDTLGQNVFRAAEKNTEEELGQKSAVVFVRSEPPDAKVKLNGQDLGDRTPLVLHKARDQKNHELELSRHGFQTTNIKFAYRSDHALTIIDAHLLGLPGKLRVATQPARLEIRIDGKGVGKSPVTTKLPARSYVVEAVDKGRTLVKQEVDVAPKENKKVTLVVPKQTSQTTLRITSSAPAEIRLNGKKTGLWTNQGAFPLTPEKKHRVSLYRHGAAQREIVVQLKNGEQQQIHLDLWEPS